MTPRRFSRLNFAFFTCVLHLWCMFDFIFKEKPDFFRYFQVANFSNFKVTPYFEIFIKNAENAPGCPTNIIFHYASYRKQFYKKLKKFCPYNDARDVRCSHSFWENSKSVCFFSLILSHNKVDILGYNLEYSLAWPSSIFKKIFLIENFILIFRVISADKKYHAIYH